MTEAQRNHRSNRALKTAPGVEVRGPLGPGYDRILTPDALEFVAGLERRFRDQRSFLLMLRQETMERLQHGARLDFLLETRPVRESEWTIEPVPDDLQDRRVEITGPVDRKMIVNALNSGANVFMADFEDSSSPTWANMVEGQLNLRDAVRRRIDFTHPTTGKRYELGDHTATLVVRPRGWHLLEEHVLVDGTPVSASLFDFGLYFWHNASALIARGTGPYFYLPKLESHLEARLWNSVFLHAQEALGIPRGTIKATVLIETILAAFEMDEILYQLREHSAGLNCGRWDYIFSVIKRFGDRPGFVMPDRGLVTMDAHFLRSYSELSIRTCHRRGAHAIGGMAAQIPIKGDAARNAAAIDKVRADKEREARAGHDGTWVAHPALVPIAKAEFDKVMATPNQIERRRDDVEVTARDLLAVPEGPKTEAALRHNVRVALLYMSAWLRGNGCVPIDNLMEDAATAEISRAQVWQWLHHRVRLDTGVEVDRGLFDRTIDDVLARVEVEVGSEAFAAGRYDVAAKVFADLVTSPECAEFLTTSAYPYLLSLQPPMSPGDADVLPLPA